MKKIIITFVLAVVCLIPQVSSADYNGVASISQSSIPNGNGSYVYKYDLINGGNGVYTSADPILSSSYTNGSHYGFVWGTGCSSSNYQVCQDSASGNTPVEVYVHNGLFYTTIPSSQPSTSLSSLITTASSSITTAFGFGFENGVLFMKEQMWLIVASGLGILQSVVGFITALLVISSIVGLIYLGFRYFRH